MKILSIIKTYFSKRQLKVDRNARSAGFSYVMTNWFLYEESLEEIEDWIKLTKHLNIYGCYERGQEIAIGVIREYGLDKITKENLEKIQCAQ